jgi:transcriptional regulator with XRE-family HTH domain
VIIPEVLMSHDGSPVIQRRRLRAELRRARIEAGLTQEEVAEAMDWSPSKIIRIETGSVGISMNDLRALLSLYRIVDPPRHEELVSLARAAKQPSWWNTYRGSVPQRLLQFIEYEQAASVIRSCEPMVIPELLQTQDYVTGIMRTYKAKPDSEAIRARMEILRERQRLHDLNDPPSIFFIIGEAAIYWLMGDKATRSDQVARLINLANKPNITLEIVPFSIGLYREIVESFTILEFGNPSDDDILYLESGRDSIFRPGNVDEIFNYRELFEDLSDMSLGPTGSLAYLSDIARDIA